MPCPYFEPQTVMAKASIRLPLLDEYDGSCHAAAEPLPAPDALRLRCCNHGYSRGVCPLFPASQASTAIRLDVVKAAADAVDVLYVEEREHVPVRWQTVRFVPATGALEPPVADRCAAAQIIAFSRSFLRRFPA